MRTNLPVTQVNRPYAADLNLISTTNLKGVVTYASPDFCKVSGFSLSELEGQAHNVVRHPDMPSAAFANLWSTIKSGRSWMGLVKNRCKNGDHYWVNAFVAPISKGGSTVEYQSVRTLPEAALVENGERIYKQIRQGATPWRMRLPSIGLRARLLALVVAGLLPFTLLGISQGMAGELWAALAASLAVIVAGGAWSLRHLTALVAETRKVVDDPLTQLVYTGRIDDFSQISVAFRMVQSQLRAVVGRVLDSSHQVGGIAEDSVKLGKQTSANIEAQQQELEQIAAAMHEMSSTSLDMARNSSNTADATQQTQALAQQGLLTLQDSIEAVKAMAQQLQKASELVRELDKQGGRIVEVVSVIGGIADQTNLLALNAAIEAARAGEQGRGFAVVADEVRALAKRTQDSTGEIQRMANAIQQGTQGTVDFISEGETLSKECVGKSDLAVQAFRNIVEQVNGVTDMNHQIACAVEEQSAVVEDMSQKVNHINDIARVTSSLGADTMRYSQEVQEHLQSQLSLITHFLKEAGASTSSARR
jgi:aerotaxis receptor